MEDWTVYVDGVRIEDDDAFAMADGFTNAAAMYDWFRDQHGFPFEGTLIQWGQLSEK
jgi:hypothetical protein